MRHFSIWVVIFVICLAGCGSGALLEYGDAAAHFHEDAVLAKAEPYLGKKIVVKGVVSKQDLIDPENCKIYLGHSICCNLGDLKKMAQGLCGRQDSFSSAVF